MTDDQIEALHELEEHCVMAINGGYEEPLAEEVEHLRKVFERLVLQKVVLR